MKILLMCPINRTYVIMPRIGLGYLASALRKRGHTVHILDCLKEKMDYSQFRRYMNDLKPDIVGIQIFTYDLNPAKKHIEIIKEICPQSYIIVGGAHPSCYPHEILNELEKADFAFAGEAELSLPKLVEFLDMKRKANPRPMHENQLLQEIPGIIWRNDNEVICNPKEYVENLDTIDFPSWDLMDPRTYPEAPHGAFVKSFPVAPLFVTRGCPFPCTFCAGKMITGKKVRSRSVANVMEEMKLLMNRYGVKEFTIEDDNFTLKRNLVQEFCDEILRRGWKIHWSCPAGVRLDTLDKELLLLMEKAGCYSFGVGIESGSQRILDHMKKKITLELIRGKIELIAQTKIKVTGFIILGYPEETRDDILASLRFSRELKMGRLQLNNFMPLPGSEIYDQLLKNGKIGNMKSNSYYVHDVSYTPDGISTKELKRLQQIGYLRFYLRPRIIWGLLREIRSFAHFKYLMKRLWDAFKLS